MKRNSTVHRHGPYVVSSCSAGGVPYVAVYPAYTSYGDGWVESRAKQHGGGPGMFTSIVLAQELEAFLNQGYDVATIEKWKAELTEARKPEMRRFERRLKRMFGPEEARQ